MKRFISILLSIILCLSISPYAMAASNTAASSNDKLLAINANNSSQYALSFVKSIFPGTNWSAGEILVIYNENDAVGGFCVDILDGAQDNGYVIVKFANNEPVISEFCIEPNINNPYEEIINDAGITDTALRYYSIGPNDYHILSNTTSSVFGLDSKSIPITQFSEYKEKARAFSAQKLNQAELNSSDSSEDVIVYSGLDGYSVISNTYSGTKTGGYTITGATNISYYCDDDVNNNGYVYACALVALSNLMKYYRSIGYTNIDSDFQTIYSELWAYAGTDTSGGTRLGNIGPAAEDYLADQNYDCSSSTPFLTTYSTFTNALYADKPCILSYGAIFNGEEDGHSVFTIGYVTTTAYQYLAILDGWNRSIRYINYNGYDYSSRAATTFSISE